ncbi:BLUF domain-containing protein [Rhodopila sp.]|jgi:hypothetical protein|uniref:BLUF domain-containing protein n=1 Tax=Rhodopila sp. TaxID=2480087 RepID=UPI002C808592|nr:BLUF domain-containing protein [Rhodopila sp.]HVZ09368.1 BLUF domain-containing protein [Rhodopila sp.]
MKRDVTLGPLYRLIYCSRSTLAAGADADRALRALLATARWRNEADQLTGALLASPSGFAQVLEGPRDAVERRFQRISVDPRHTEVSMLTLTPTSRRLFPDSPLAFCGHIAAGGEDPLTGLLEDTRRGDQRAITGTDVLRQLVRLVRAAEAPPA